MKIVVKQIGRHEQLGNGIALVEIDGQDYTAFRQGGGLNFWAGQFRTRLSRDERKELDRTLDESLEQEEMDEILEKLI